MTLAVDSSAEPGSAQVPLRYSLEASLGHLLRRAQQRHVALFQERLGAEGVTPPQFATLVRLAELGQVTQNRLGRLVAMDPATIQGVAQRLMARGLVQSARDPMDRRTVVLSLTAAGQDALDRWAAQAHATNEALLGPLGDAERDMLLDMLRRISA